VTSASFDFHNVHWVLAPSVGSNNVRVLPEDVAKSPASKTLFKIKIRKMDIVTYKGCYRRGFDSMVGFKSIAHYIFTIPY
jgi:hypothetical protein